VGCVMGKCVLSASNFETLNRSGTQPPSSRQGFTAPSPEATNTCKRKVVYKHGVFLGEFGTHAGGRTGRDGGGPGVPPRYVCKCGGRSRRGERVAMT